MWENGSLEASDFLVHSPGTLSYSPAEDWTSSASGAELQPGAEHVFLARFLQARVGSGLGLASRR